MTSCDVSQPDAPPTEYRAAPATADGHRTHWAHVAVVTIHSVCCGAPIAISLLGLAASTALGAGVLRFHTFLHGGELWLLALSAALVAAGAAAEFRIAKRTWATVSVLFWVSVGCLVFNAAIVAGHRLGA
jgi:hypothetical protein